MTLPRISSAYGLLVEGEQKLVVEDWNHVYTLGWRELYQQWLNRPLKKYEAVHGKPLIPTRPEYREAMEAILDKSFWTDNKWDGQRQLCFFAAYRLLRYLGYSHADLWEGGIMTAGIESYKKQSDITYWKSRGKSSLVEKIDEDIDNYEASLEARQ